MLRRPRLYWQFTWFAAALFVPAALALELFHADSAIAHAFFFHASHWAGSQNWWINEFLHTGGRWAVRVVVTAAFAFWVACLLRPSLKIYRRPCGFFVLAAVLSIVIVGLLKTITNVHCPWDLTEFGGAFPHISLFAARPPSLEPGQCFPAAHSGSGYALMALYFAFRERSKILARLGLILGVLMGMIFGLAQESRGAHFLSHDVWSAFLVWMILAAIYIFAFRADLWTSTGRESGKHA